MNYTHVNVCSPIGCNRADSVSPFQINK